MRVETTELLDRPIYGIKQVDRLLRLSHGTAARWIEGYQRNDKFYDPIVREHPSGSELVTWGEFVETRLLSEFRTNGVAIRNLRLVVNRLREETDLRYPLASSKLFVDGREIVAKVEEDEQVDKAIRLVVVRTNQYLLSDAAQRFFNAVKWDEASTNAETIEASPNTPQILFDPRRSFGEPSARGVRATVLAGEYYGGMPVNRIADAFDLSEDQVREAIKFVESFGRAA